MIPHLRPTTTTPTAKRYYFDLSSSARWGGNAVGIIRVERELAKRAQDFLGSDVQFCVYDKVGQQFLHVPKQDAMDIVNGRAWFSFDPPPLNVLPSQLTPVSRILSEALKSLPQEISFQLLQRPKAYVFLQKIRGRQICIKDVEHIRAERERALSAGGAWAQTRWRLRSWLLERPRVYQAVSFALGRKFSLDDALRIRDQHARSSPQTSGDLRYALQRFPNRIDLDSNCVVISGGLDWDHKDMRTIYSLKKRDSFKYVAIIYDLIPLKFPHFVVPGYDAHLRDYIGELLWAADHGLCISKTTCQDLQEYAYDNGIDRFGATVFPLGNDLPGSDKSLPVDSIADLPQQINGRRFGLFVSTIEPRKNHRVLYEAWDQCVRSGTVDPSRHCLVFAGRRGWGTDDLVREIESNPATKNSIILLNHVSDDLLAELYNRSGFNLFPSHYEGYGLPLAEALLTGKAAFASDAGALSEIGGDMVVRLHPKDTQSWAAELARAMTDSDYVDALSRRTREEFRPTTWADAAKVFFAQVREAVL